jgi:Piwi domain
MLDDNNFTYIDLETLTYRLCFMYARATKSVSVVPCVYYAHLACARSRFHIQGNQVFEVDSRLGEQMYFL